MTGVPSLIRKGHVPVPRSPLIGRSREIAAAASLLSAEHTHLLTFTGPGGVGKTRLALAVAAELLDSVSGGVWFVPLAPVTDPDLVASSISAALGLHDVGASSPRERVLRFVAAHHVLLILDNFEQVISAVPFVADLLAAGPSLQIIVTSRTPLRIDGEREFPVPPLSLSREDERSSGRPGGSVLPVSPSPRLVRRRHPLRPAGRHRPARIHAHTRKRRRRHRDLRPPRWPPPRDRAGRRPGQIALARRPPRPTHQPSYAPHRRRPRPPRPPPNPARRHRLEPRPAHPLRTNTLPRSRGLPRRSLPDGR